MSFKAQWWRVWAFHRQNLCLNPECTLTHCMDSNKSSCLRCWVGLAYHPYCSWLREEWNGIQHTDSLACAHVAAVAQSLSHVWLLATPCNTPGSSVLPSLSPGVCSDSCPLSWWYYLTICCLLLLLPSIFPSIRVFSKSYLFTSAHN